MKIFNYLRDEHLGMEIPFLKYKDIAWNQTKCIIYKDFSNEIKQKQLMEWVYSVVKNPDTGETRTFSRVRGLLIRKRLREGQYVTINIFKNGIVEYKANFQEIASANLGQVEEAVEDLASLIRKINKIDYRLNKSITDKTKIPIPKIILTKT